MKNFLVVLLILLVFLLPVGWKLFNSSYVKIPPKHAGYKTVWGQIQDTTYGPGLVWFIPGTEHMGNSVTVVNVQPKNYKYVFDVKTKNMQKIKLNVSVLQEPNAPRLHVMANQYSSYDDYQKQVVQDLLNSVMVTLCGLTDIWSLVGGYEEMTLDAVNYIVNDQLINDNYVNIRAIRLLGFEASPEFEQLMEKTAQAQQEISLEELKAKKAEVETKKVMEEAKQTYERMAAVAKANGLEIQIKAQALKDNPFVAQYEMAKALQNWNGEISLPQTLSIIEASNKGLPIMPFMNLNGATSGK
ncbi:MAG: hypothetical protein J6T72_01150 [Alphaproteobacteria bacterium]|nr:hypothetical protein [Alphaproteobacteria bacterium]